MIYLSNFDTAGEDDRAISIARVNPKGYKGKSRKDLAPRQEMLTKFHKGQITDAEFWFEYVEKIYTFDLDQLVEELDNHILLCHCSKDILCHRLMLAFYLHAETGVECEEIGGFGSILTLPFNEVELPVRFNITPETRKEVGLDLPIDDLVGHWRELKKLDMTFLYS